MTGYISGILYNPQGDLPPLTPNLPPNHEDLLRSLKTYGTNISNKSSCNRELFSYPITYRRRIPVILSNAV